MQGPHHSETKGRNAMVNYKILGVMDRWTKVTQIQNRSEQTISCRFSFYEVAKD
jgi:hypothetical protein